MGHAEHWQDRVIETFHDLNVVFLNPRRAHFDETIPQRADNKEFRTQVEWELEGLQHANLIIMYFDRDSQSPISFLELGLFAQSHKMMVFCPEGFWRKGNIDVECEHFSIPHFQDEQTFLAAVRARIETELKIPKHSYVQL